MGRIGPIIGSGIFAVSCCAYAVIEIAAARYAWGALLIAGAALSLHGLRLTAARHRAAGRHKECSGIGSVLERAVQLLWAFAGGVAVTLAVTERGIGSEAGALYLAAAACCLLGVIATAATHRISPSRGVDGR